MFFHDDKTLQVSLFDVSAAQSALLEAADEQTGVANLVLVSPFDCRKHPVIVGSDAIRRIIVRTDAPTYQYRLMTHAHAPSESLCLQLHGQLETASTHTLATAVANHRITIVNIHVRRRKRENLFERRTLKEHISGV